MILLNFIISLLNQSYEKVLNNATIITYSIKVGLNQEAYVITKAFKEHLGLVKKGSMSMFLLTANSESNDNSEWKGYIKSVKNFIQAESSILLTNICELLKPKEDPLNCEHNAETMKACIEKTRLSLVESMGKSQDKLDHQVDKLSEVHE